MEEIIAMTPSHICDPQIAIAACRAGALGILDLGLRQDGRVVTTALHRLARYAGSIGTWGIRWNTFGTAARSPSKLTEYIGERVAVLVLAGIAADDLVEAREQGNRVAERLLLEVYDIQSAQAAQTAGYDGVVVKGYEAGGRVSSQGSFILLQTLHQELSIPFWIQGGISLHTAAAARLGGAAGVVLCEQLWLTDEAPFAPEQRAVWRQFDGSETMVVRDGTQIFRLFTHSRLGKLRELETALARQADSPGMLSRLLVDADHESLLPIGQDLAFAQALSQRYKTVGRVIAAFRNAINACRELARVQQPWVAGSALARRHGTQYPIVQGPMTRVSDTVPFAKAVAAGGGLPFLALAVMRGPEVQTLLTEAKAQLGSLPWGVGILGFVPTSLRQEQLAVIKAVKPPFALVAGGRPSQAMDLERHGISTYLHVPSPGLLQLFMKDGARKFVFEGSECGGHTGPRTSFVLWELAVETLLATEVDDPEALQILFAGGIHDARSAALVATLAAPLMARGMQVGVLMGSAYLFTEEAVRTGAILQEYQDQALACESTELLQSGIGYATRCARTLFCDEFNKIKQQLILAGKSDTEILEALEQLNIGRLRIASKGILHNAQAQAGDERNKYLRVDTDIQRREGMYMLGEVAILRNRTVSIADLHTDVSAGSMALLAKALPVVAEPVNRNSDQADIAIVGMACLLPGAANARTFWHNILRRVDAIREVSDERWRAVDFFDPNPAAPDKVYAKWGGFLDDVQFDPTAYGIPPISLRSIEPVQLLALEVARAALADAGFDRLPFPRERTAVIFGAGGMHDLACDYIFRTMLRSYLPRVEGLPQETQQYIIDSLCQQQLPQWTEDTFPGFLDNVNAGRVANRLDLRGSNFTVDAACASSLAALDVGIKQLRLGEADVVLVGAVDGTNNAVSFMAFAKTHALSPRGRCRPFDDSADGIAISEGVTALVLKRLRDAERDGDQIYAVIKGIGSSSDGRNRSLTAPHPDGQVSALRRAYDDARVDPSTVELVEAHGTGTALGDKTEIESLNIVFDHAQAALQSCAIGSVKSMIGHTKMSAGLASVIKGALALHQKVLPPTMGMEKPNAQVDFARTPFYINTDLRPWFNSRHGLPRRCGISAFGFGGTNFHTVLEEYSGSYRTSDALDLGPREAELFVFTRRHRSEVEQAAARLLETLTSLEAIDLTDLAYAIHLQESAHRPGGEGHNCRLAIVATSVPDLRQKLQAALRELAHATALKTPGGVYYGECDSTASGVCALFPGQGSQKVNMLRDLVVSLPALRGLFEQADTLLQGHLPQPLSRYIYPIPVFSEAQCEQQQAALTATQVAQPALGAVDLFAFDVLRHFGLQPDLVAGHSYGEYVALHVAGVLSREDLFLLSAIRGRLSAEASKTHPSTLAVVQADAEATMTAVQTHRLPVSLASVNAPDQTVIGGSETAIEQAVTTLCNDGLRAKRLPVTAAFHTTAMAEAAKTLAATWAEVTFHKPTLPVYSNTTADCYPDDVDGIREILAHHLTKPLRFVEQVQHMYQAGARVFIETGPGQVLSGLVTRILADRPHTTLAIDVPGRSGWLQVAHLLAQAQVLGMSVDMSRWFQNRHLPQRSLDQLVKQAQARANPGPTIWRVNGGKAVPWHQKVVATTRAVNVPVATEQTPTITEPAPRPAPAQRFPVNNSGSRHMPQDETQAPVTESQAAAPAMNSGLLLSQFQTGMAQYLDVLQGQQQVMQHCLSLQQQFMSALLNGQVKAGAVMGLQLPQVAPTQTRQPVSVVSTPLSTVPPAPVLPSSVPTTPPAPVLPSLPVAAGPQTPSMSAALPPPVLPKPVVVQPTAPAMAAAAGRTKPISATEEFQAALLHIVSERTGYPEEMLDLDAHLEADLGIDSIKRVEIFGALEEHQTVLEGKDEETILDELAGLKTLRRIVEWYGGNRTRMLAAATGSEKKKF